MAGPGASATASVASDTTCGSPEVAQHVEQDVAQRLAESFVKACAMLGMSAQAPYGWAMIHEKPHVGCMVYSSSVSAAIAMIAVMYVGAVPWGIPVMNLPAIIAVVVFACCAGGVWRWGPEVAAAPAYKAAIALVALTLTFLVIAVFIGPMDYSPFGDRFVFLICISVAVFFTLLSALNGGVAADHPPQPYTSIWPSVTKSSFSTMRFVDAFTDVGVVRILLDQGPDCTWYGKEVPCMHYTRLGIIAGVLAAGNLALMTCLHQLTGMTSLFESAGSRFKLVVAINTVIMLCELGGVTIVLLKLFSDMQLTDAGDSDRLRREAAFALTSCCTTLFSFCINVLGMRKLLGVLRQTSHHFQKRLTTGQRSSRVGPSDPQQSA